jgi:thioredoxin reductase (NADPH)
MSENGYAKDVVVIGGGPAGYTAAIYAVRSGHPAVLIEGLQPGGQLTTTTDVENYPGFADPIAGPELMDAMRAQAERVGAEMINDYVERVDLSERPFRVQLGSGELRARALIIATGATAKWLGLESETRFRGRGVSACATCDGFFYRDQRVAVIGGGDTAAEEALYLTNHASEVLLVHRRDEMRASRIMAQRVLDHQKITPKWNRVLEEVLGDETGVTGIRLRDTQTDETEELAVDGVFVAIGHRPNTELLDGQLELDAGGYVVTAPDSTATSVEGVFAAGDVQDSVYRQAVTAAGTGAMAGIEASRLLDEQRL